MGCFECIEPERVSQPQSQRVRDINLSTLFQPCVPSDSNACQLRCLLTSQARCQSAQTRCDPDFGRREACPSRPEKFGQRSSRLRSFEHHFRISIRSVSAT